MVLVDSDVVEKWIREMQFHDGSLTVLVLALVSWQSDEAGIHDNQKLCAVSVYGGKLLGIQVPAVNTDYNEFV